MRAVLVLFAVLCAGCAARRVHHAHHARHDQAASGVLNATTLVSELEFDIRRLLDTEEEVNAAMLDNVQQTWFSYHSPLIRYLKNTFSEVTVGAVTDESLTIRYQSGTAMAAMGCRDNTNDIDAWLLVGSQANTEALFTKPGYYHRDRANFPEPIYRVERFPLSSIPDYDPVTNNKPRQMRLHYGTNGEYYEDGNFEKPSGYDDVELDIYFPTSHSYQYFWKSTFPLDGATFIAKPVSLMMKSADVYGFREAAGKAYNDASDVCCVCDKLGADNFRDTRGFVGDGEGAEQGTPRIKAFCRFMYMYGNDKKFLDNGKLKDGNLNQKPCQGTPAWKAEPDADDVAALKELYALWMSVGATEMTKLAKLIEAANTGNPAEVKGWIERERGKKHV